MGLAALLGDPTLADRIGTVGRKTAFLFGVLVSYLLLGAVVFQLIEYNARDEEVQETVAELDLERSQLLEVRSLFFFAHYFNNIFLSGTLGRDDRKNRRRLGANCER